MWNYTNGYGLRFGNRKGDKAAYQRNSEFTHGKENIYRQPVQEGERPESDRQAFRARGGQQGVCTLPGYRQGNKGGNSKAYRLMEDMIYTVRSMEHITTMKQIYLGDGLKEPISHFRRFAMWLWKDTYSMTVWDFV